MVVYCHEQLSVIIKTPRETDFILDLPLSNKWLSYSLPSLHDVNPMTYYTNFSRLSMEELELPEFDSYSTFDTQFTPSCSGTDAVFIDATCSTGASRRKAPLLPSPLTCVAQR